MKWIRLRHVSLRLMDGRRVNGFSYQDCSDELQGDAAAGCSAGSEWKAQGDCDQDPVRSRSGAERHRTQGAVGALERKQREGEVCIESGDAKKRTQDCD